MPLPSTTGVEVALSLAILAGSYLVARLVAALVGALARRVRRRGRDARDGRLIAALERPVAYALFLTGAFVAIERLPFSLAWIGRLEQALVLWAIALATLALVRAYHLLIDWLTSEALARAEPGMAAEFGPLAQKVGTVVLVVVGAISALQRLGIEVSSLIVSLGVGSLAVGLAAQDTLANMFAGFTLMLDRPFKTGERVRLASGEVGDVEAIGIRATRIKTVDDTILIVPNSVLVKERVVNQSRPTRALLTRLEVSVPYGSDLALVREILCEAARGSVLVAAEPAPAAHITRFGDGIVCLLLVFAVRDYSEQALALTLAYEEIDRRFRAAGIELPRLAERSLAPTATRR